MATCSGVCRNQTGSPVSSTTSTPRRPGPEDGVMNSSPGAVPFSRRSTCTFGGSRAGSETKWWVS